MDERLKVLLERRRRFLVFLERRLGRADAEDVLQHGLVVALRRMEDLRSDESLVAWFYQVLRNLVTDQLRRRTTAATTIAEFTRDEPTHQAPDDELFTAACACLYDVLPLLKPQPRNGSTSFSGATAMPPLGRQRPSTWRSERIDGCRRLQIALLARPPYPAGYGTGRAA